jgi:hypothetical protein
MPDHYLLTAASSFLQHQGGTPTDWWHSAPNPRPVARLSCLVSNTELEYGSFSTPAPQPYYALGSSWGHVICIDARQLCNRNKKALKASLLTIEASLSVCALFRLFAQRRPFGLDQPVAATAREMPTAAACHNIPYNAESRLVTSADDEWLKLPASQEIPHSFSHSFQQAPDSTARLQLRRTPQPTATIPTGELLQFNRAETTAAADSGIWAASGSSVPNAFQHLMKKSKASKYLKKEQRLAIFPERKQQYFNFLIHICCSSIAISKKSSVRNACAMIVPPGKRQKQPSINQFLPSGTAGDRAHMRELPPPQHDLAGVWLPARASKRASSNVTTAIAFSNSSNRTCHVDRERERFSHPLDEQPQHSQPAEEHFSMTLSLGSNSEDECLSDQQSGRQSQDFVEPQPEHQQNHHDPSQSQQLMKHSPELFQPRNACSEPEIAETEISCSRHAAAALLLNPDPSLLESTSSATATFTSPASSSLPSNGCDFSPSSSISFMLASSDVSRKSPSCSHHIDASHTSRSECTQSQMIPFPAVSLFASGQIVLGTLLYFL